MSEFVHVAAVFRVDRFPGRPEPDWEACFGSMPDELEWSLGRASDEHKLAYWCCSAYGDIEYGNVDAVAEWFQDACCGFDWLRQAALSAFNDGDGSMRVLGCRRNYGLLDEDGDASYEFFGYGR